MVFNSITDLIDDDILGARPGSPPYLGSTSSSVCSSPGPCGGCSSGLSLPMSFLKSGQQADAKLAPRLFARMSEQQYQAMVENLRQKCKQQELELQKSSKKIQEAMAWAAKEASKARASEDVIQTLKAQLKGMAKRLPARAYDAESTIPAYFLSDDLELNDFIFPIAHSMSSFESASSTISSWIEGLNSHRDASAARASLQNRELASFGGVEDGHPEEVRLPNVAGNLWSKKQRTWWSENRERVYEWYNDRRPDGSLRLSN